VTLCDGSPIAVSPVKLHACPGLAHIVRVGEDFVGGFGPDEWFRVGVPVLDPGLDVAFECGDAVVHAAADLAVGEEPEPAFDLIELGGAGRGEVQMATPRSPGAST
jgi:hypothetical protein